MKSIMFFIIPALFLFACNQGDPATASEGSSPAQASEEAAPEGETQQKATHDCPFAKECDPQAKQESPDCPHEG